MITRAEAARGRETRDLVEPGSGAEGAPALGPVWDARRRIAVTRSRGRAAVR